MVEVPKVLSGYKFIDLFAGIGGFHISMTSLGAKCVFASEIDELASLIYKNNFDIKPSGDIRSIKAKDIPDFDILCAGFPCQPFSIAGQRKGFNDTRGTLFFEVMRIVKEKLPKILFLENVRNLVSHNNGKTFNVIIKTIEQAGYNVYYKVLNSADYGVPQSRFRIYIVGVRKDIALRKTSEFHFPTKMILETSVRNVLESEDLLPQSVMSTSTTSYKLNNIIKIKNGRPIRVGQVNNGGQGERIYSIDGTSITLMANGGGKFSKTGGYLMDNGIARKLSPNECKKLMGFPDNFKIHSNNQVAYKQFGNSVVVDVIQYIGLSIGQYIIQ